MTGTRNPGSLKLIGIDILGNFPSLKSDGKILMLSTKLLNLLGSNLNSHKTLPTTPSGIFNSGFLGEDGFCGFTGVVEETGTVLPIVTIIDLSATGIRLKNISLSV